MNQPPSPLVIGVLGCGNIGSTFAFQLARGGHDVTVFARPGSARLAQLLDERAIVDVDGKRASVRVAEQVDAQVEYDLLIVTVLAHQISAVLPSLQGSRAKSIQFMFNTFDPDGLQQAVGRDRCAFGMPFVQAKLDGTGKLKAKIGAVGQKTLLSQQRWVELFNAAGLPAVLEPDMPLWLRCHAPMCIAFESVSVAGMHRGGGASWAEALALARGVHACFRVIEALGYPVYPRSKQRIDRFPLPVVAVMLWSMSRVRSFRELLATGKAEADALVDAIVLAATRAGTPTPLASIEAMRPL